MKNKLKVLLIVGIHGNEERTKRIMLDSLLIFNNRNMTENLDIDFFDISSDSIGRDVAFNLNRLDEIDRLSYISMQMQSLKNHIQNYDIILDLHNSEICKNVLLVSSGNFKNPGKNDYTKWKIDKANKKYKKMVIWRESKFVSISEYARNLGKISFTVEFNGMNTNKKFTPKKDINFLFKSIELCKHLFKNINNVKSSAKGNHPVKRIKLFTESNKLRNITLSSKQFLFGGKVIPGIEVEQVDEVHNSDTETLFENYKFTVICPERNETKGFEGTMKKIKKGKKINGSQFAIRKENYL